MLLRLLLASAALAGPAFAQTAPAAQTAYVERRALLALDAACGLFDAPVREALEAGAWQARSTLLRQGWTPTRVAGLESAALGAAQARGCGDPRTASAQAEARAAFEAWRRAPSAAYPGAHRAWAALRNPGDGGWKLRQDAPAPHSATFGIRQGVPDALAFAAPLNGARAPAAAQLILRDPARADVSALDAPGRQARGLEAGAPPPNLARRYFANNRSIETAGGARRIVFAFPDEALRALIALDPRESFAIELQGARTERYLFEAGDLRAAIAFLNAR